MPNKKSESSQTESPKSSPASGPSPAKPSESKPEVAKTPKAEPDPRDESSLSDQPIAPEYDPSTDPYVAGKTSYNS